ncbi:MAG: hypothetical protein WAN89_02880 [Lawsonella sp.]
MRKTVAAIITALSLIILVGCNNSIPMQEDEAGEFKVPETAYLNNTNYGKLNHMLFQEWIDLEHSVEELIEFYEKETPTTEDFPEDFKFMGIKRKPQYPSADWCWQASNSPNEVPTYVPTYHLQVFPNPEKGKENETKILIERFMYSTGCDTDGRVLP